jgi:hypothetical protein
MSSQDPTLADRSQRHRLGLKAELREIKAAVEDLRADVRQVLATRMVRKTITSSEREYHDD